MEYIFGILLILVVAASADRYFDYLERKMYHDGILQNSKNETERLREMIIKRNDGRNI